MASAAPKTVASLPLYTVVALCGFITEVLMRLLNGVAGEPARPCAMRPASGRVRYNERLIIHDSSEAVEALFTSRPHAAKAGTFQVVGASFCQA
jgi:hypothetical protein